jgi:hypothetical protein
LRHAGFISQADAKDLIDRSRLGPPDAFTRNYRQGRFPFAADAVGRGRRKPDEAEADALVVEEQFEFA